jgi:flagellar hook assembly protein FlgD
VAGANTLTWDGRDADSVVVPDGDYTLHFTARDRT